MPSASGRTAAIAITAVLACTGALATTVPGTAAPAPQGVETLATTPPRTPLAGDAIYFVMTDRYRDGNPANNEGGGAAWSTGGFDPADPAMWHGGDLAGLTGRCDPSDPQDDGLARLARLGFTAVWITPPFVNRAVQGSSAGYHGYWFMDLSKPDPHLGTQAEFEAFTACAQRLGIKVILDVVANHTADAFSYREGSAYVPVDERPYRSAAGRRFDPMRFAARNEPLPRLSMKVSFPKRPVIDPSLRGAKVPAILNEPTRYHNRGDIDWGTCSGVCEMDGDFYGLDDIMTEDAEIVRALGGAYGDWVERYGIAGFRLDTAKHVDPSFWRRFLPIVGERAAAAGNPSFTSFGEVWLEDPVQLAGQMHARGLPSVLDFPFQSTVRRFATQDATGRSLALLFADDDRYASATTSAYGLATFLGNHDMGRIGYFLATDSPDEGTALLQRSLLAHDVLMLTRGVPVVYYGDEVGMTGSGDGRDQRARQDMFPTQVETWRVEERIGGQPIADGSSFDESSPLEARVRTLTGLRASHPALAQGAQITRYADDTVFAASRIDATDRREYLIAFNTSGDPTTVVVPTSTPDTTWVPLLGGGGSFSSASSGDLRIALPPRGTLVLRAAGQLPPPVDPSVSVRIGPDRASGTYAARATVPGTDPATVTFVVRRPGGAWRVLASDDARPFRAYLDPQVLGRGTRVQVSAIVTATSGARGVSSTVPVRLAPLD